MYDTLALLAFVLIFAPGVLYYLPKAAANYVLRGAIWKRRDTHNFILWCLICVVWLLPFLGLNHGLR